MVIIPCGFQKGPKKTIAKSLYTGPYFLSNLNWALSVSPPDNVFILSALHGLITLKLQIEPYDLKMGNKGSVSPSLVKKQIEELNFGTKKVYAIGGEKYLNCLKLSGLKFCSPVARLPMGKSMSVLKKNKGVLPPWKEYL